VSEKDCGGEPGDKGRFDGHSGKWITGG
jgi:hypothetical protein